MPAILGSVVLPEASAVRQSGQVKAGQSFHTASVRLSRSIAQAGKLTGARRAVELASGQAFFEVKGDQDRPFVVSAGATDVTAVGTRFDVRRAGVGAQVTLIEGKVDVRHRTESAPRWSLIPGEQIVTTSRRPEVRSVDVATETSWTGGRLIFSGDTVEAAVAEVNRYSRTKVVLQAPAIARIPVSGPLVAVGRPVPSWGLTNTMIEPSCPS